MVTSIDIAPRIVLKPDRTKGIIQYDIDNAYPQRVGNIIDGSGISKRCVQTFHKFIIGDGLVNMSLSKTKVNNVLTIDKFIRAIAADYAKFKGFAFHANYNVLGQVTDITPVPFEHVRICDPDTENKGMLAVYDDWDKTKRRSIEKDKVQYIFPYSPEDVLEEIAIQEGGIEAYKGQLFYFSGDGAGVYPKAFIDPELETAITDSKVKTFHFKNITTSFMASHMFLYKGKFADDDERNEYVSKLKSFQGADNTSKIFMVDDVTNETKPELIPFTIPNNDRLFEVTENSAHDRIRKTFGIPPVLISSLTSGKLGTAQEIKDATVFYNSMTIDDRNIMSETLREIMPRMANPVNDNFEIKPLTIIP